MRAELSGEVFFARIPRDSDNAVATFGRVLNAQMAKAAESLNGHGGARRDLGLAYAVKNGDAGAEDRRVGRGGEGGGDGD